MREEHAGGCSCGAVRFRMTAAPMFTHCCHCTDCQRQTGTAFVLNALIEADRVILEQGETAPFPQPTESGKPHTIFRCAACGTALWSAYGGVDNVLFVRVGALDRAHTIAPDVHIYTRSKVPWVALPPGALAFEAYYSAKDVWPEENLKRRTAAFARAAN